MIWKNPTRPDLYVRRTRRKLACRVGPYWNIILYGRHIGYQRLRATKTYWVARYRTKNGTYRQHRLGLADDRKQADGVSIFSFEQALALAWKWFADLGVVDSASKARPIGINENISYQPSGDVYTVGHALSEYLEWKRLAAARSYLQTLVCHINFHLLPRVGLIPANDFNAEYLRIFVKDVLETPPKRGNQTMAWENGKIENDRSWRALRHLPNVNRPRVLHLSRPECLSLLDACAPDLRRLVLGALYTGCRATELLRMDASQVGRDGYGVYVTPVKTYQPRFVFLPDEGMAFFLALAKNKHPRDRLFIRDNGNLWFSNYRHPFKQAVRRMNLPDDFCFHGLRHTYASQLIQSGTPLPVVAEQLGHSNADTVSRTYGHLAPQVRESEVRQRFTVLSPENARKASRKKTSLKSWRESLHGSDWRTYASISSLSDN